MLNCNRKAGRVERCCWDKRGGTFNCMHESRLSQPRGTVDCVPQFEPEKPQKESAFSDLSCSMSGDKYAQE